MGYSIIFFASNYTTKIALELRSTVFNLFGSILWTISGAPTKNTVPILGHSGAHSGWVHKGQLVHGKIVQSMHNLGQPVPFERVER